jgi:hypothetical protein
MCGIGNRHFERVAEDRGCLHELDSVLLEILGRLVRVPFEFHSEILSSSVPIGITLHFSRGRLILSPAAVGCKCLLGSASTTNRGSLELLLGPVVAPNRVEE